MVEGQRIAVVTGACGGVGSATVDVFHREGYHVIGVDRRSGSTADEHLNIDLSADTCGEMIAQHLGDRPVHALVNNGATAVYSEIETTTLEEWNEVVDTNLRAPFLVAKALLPSLKAGRGAIVNVSSVHAEATSVGIAAYASSKGGLLALTRAMSLEWAPYSIRVNCVLPGAVDTQMLRDGLFRSGSTIHALGRKHPLGRVADPHEIGEVIAFLADRRSSFVTGAALRVDGGAVARLSTE